MTRSGPLCADFFPRWLTLGATNGHDPFETFIPGVATGSNARTLETCLRPTESGRSFTVRETRTRPSRPDSKGNEHHRVGERPPIATTTLLQRGGRGNTASALRLIDSRLQDEDSVQRRRKRPAPAVLQGMGLRDPLERNVCYFFSKAWLVLSSMYSPKVIGSYFAVLPPLQKGSRQEITASFLGLTKKGID